MCYSTCLCNVRNAFQIYIEHKVFDLCIELIGSFKFGGHWAVPCLLPAGPSPFYTGSVRSTAIVVNLF